MHVIIFFSVYLSFYEKIIIISKCINVGLNMMNKGYYFHNPDLLENIISFRVK